MLNSKQNITVVSSPSFIQCVLDAFFSIEKGKVWGVVYVFESGVFIAIIHLHNILSQDYYRKIIRLNAWWIISRNTVIRLILISVKHCAGFVRNHWRQEVDGRIFSKILNTVQQYQSSQLYNISYHNTAHLTRHISELYYFHTKQSSLLHRLLSW